MKNKLRGLEIIVGRALMGVAVVAIFIILKILISFLYVWSNR